MTVWCGVYGYQITRPIVLPSLSIQPRTSDHIEAQRWAHDIEKYQLVAVVKANSVSEDRLFKLEAILSFIEHMDVIITPPVESREDDPFKHFDASMTAHQRHRGGGAVIGDDSFFPGSRSAFICKALAKLEDPIFCERTKFDMLFFKAVEWFRQRKPFVEVSYFFLYSGLESYARAVMNDRTKNSSKPICTFLKQYGFDVDIDRPGNLARSLSTYKRLRDGLFHNSELSSTLKVRGQTVSVDASNYLFHLSQLVSLVVMKAVEFDDGHINWDSWISRQPFK
jgi:hypothetical protein